MRICLLDHHGKASYLARQLFDTSGFEAGEPFDSDVLLVDTDHPHAAPYPEKHLAVLEAMRRGVQVGLYPHGGLPILDYDGWRKPLGVAFELVHGEGHKLVYEAIGLKRRVEVVGWSYSDIGPVEEWVGAHDTTTALSGGSAQAKRVGGAKHVLFAPIHPWADGKTILPIHKALNEAAYREFLAFDCERKTVRMFGDDEPNGVVERVDGVDYTASDLTLGVDVIDSADGVISYGTFACTALARGKRVAMIYPYPAHTSDDGAHEAKRFPEYAELCRYPASIGDAPLEELFARDTSEWERLFVGGPLDVEKLEWVIGSYKLNRDQRRRLVRA